MSLTLLLIPILAQGLRSQPLPNVDTKPSPSGLLEESYGIGAGMLPQSRGWLLFALADAASQINPKKAELWSEELFNSTFDLTPGEDRAALQKNALVVLSRQKVDLAFSKQALMDSPTITDGRIAEDVRAFLSISLFLAYGGTQPSLARMRAIRERAALIGSNGAYPYRGVSPLLKAFWLSGNVEVEGWWQDILVFLAKGSPVANANEEFIALLTGVWDALPDVQKKPALQALQKALSTTPYLHGKNASYHATVDTNHGTYELAERNHVLLLRVLPKLSEWLPDAAARAKDLSPVFGAAAANDDFAVRSVREAVTYSSKENSSTASLTTRSMTGEQAVYRKIAQLRVSDPGQAIELASGLDFLRGQAFQLIAATGDQEGPEWVAKLSSRLPASLDDTKDRELRFWMLSFRARAALGKDAPGFRLAWRGAFQLGEVMYTEYAQAHPGVEPSNNPFLEPMQKLVRIPVRSEPWTSVERVRQVSDDTLKAYLLLEVAVALEPPKHAEIAMSQTDSQGRLNNAASK